MAICEAKVCLSVEGYMLVYLGLFQCDFKGLEQVAVGVPSAARHKF